jgi:hypothetical protein
MLRLTDINWYIWPIRTDPTSTNAVKQSRSMRQTSAVTLLQNKSLDVTTDISLPYRHAGVHTRSKHLEAASKFRASEEWRNWGPTDTGCHCTKFSRNGDMVSQTCAALGYKTGYLSGPVLWCTRALVVFISIPRDTWILKWQFKMLVTVTLFCAD